MISALSHGIKGQKIRIPKKKSEDNNYYFNTEDIQKITADNATYYTIPAVSKADEREDILHSLSLRVSDDGLQSRMIKVQLKDDENIEIVSSVPYTFDPQSVLAREDAECTTYLVSGPCSCHSVHEAGGCTHPIQVMITQCSSGSGTNSSGSTYYTGTPSATFPGSSSGAYVYSTADQVYNSLRLKLKPNYILTDIQKFKILELPNLASQIVTFLNQNPEHKAAAISFINSIGPISTAQEMQTAISNYINTFNFNAGLSSAQNIWKTQNPALFDKVLAYILQDYPNRKDFGYWGIDFLIQNPNITWAQFQNWFLTKSEGQDGIYDEAAELAFAQQTFQQHPLPGMAQYELAFPSKPNTLYPDFYRDAQPNYVVYNDYVGGKLKQLFNQNGGANNTDNPYYNTCAVRQSYALNKLGIMIPFQHVDLTGDNNWNYIMTASKMGIFLEKTFGPPIHKLEGADANDKTKIAKFLEGKTGIYLVINKNLDEAGYTGHTDMIKNGYVSGGSNVTYPNGDIIKGGIKYIYIWELN